MRGFALTLAHAGYTTVTWDFQGHGANPNPLISSSRSNELLQDAESALNAAQTTGLIDIQRLAILGHSMGSGVALSYGTAHSDTAATIAISPVKQTVTPDLPHNLLLMAGSLEPQFFNTGTARKLVIIPNVEHISILFSPQAHFIARSWLDGTFGSQSDASNYTDRRILWFGLGILGFIMLANASINMISPIIQIKTSGRPMWLRILALFVGGIAATIILWLVSTIGVQLNQLMGILVGGDHLVDIKTSFIQANTKRVDERSGRFYCTLAGCRFVGKFRLVALVAYPLPIMVMDSQFDHPPSMVFRNWICL
jgi:pimeloyl-ACP methyl ester carboxylesterase